MAFTKEISIFIIPILQRDKLQCREAKRLTVTHLARDGDRYSSDFQSDVLATNLSTEVMLIYRNSFPG